MRIPKFTSSRILLIDLFVASGLLTVFGIRAFLEITGYPQIGNENLHIAHMLWGGFALCIVTLYLLLAINPIKFVAAVVAGSGFGFFIDELGKFITQDNNYFFKPAASLIIIIFIIIWIISRYLIAKADGVDFISKSVWPKNKLVSGFIILWLVSQIATVVGSLVYLIREPSGTFTAKTGLPIITGLLYLLFVCFLAISTFFFFKQERDKAARILRIGLIISIAIVYPVIFYKQQFAAAIGFCFSIVLALILSDHANWPKRVKSTKGPAH